MAFFRRHFILNDFGDRPGQHVARSIRQKTGLRIEGPVEALDNIPHGQRRKPAKPVNEKASVRKALYKSIRYHQMTKP